MKKDTKTNLKERGFDHIYKVVDSKSVDYIAVNTKTRTLLFVKSKENMTEKQLERIRDKNAEFIDKVFWTNFNII